MYLRGKISLRLIIFSSILIAISILSTNIGYVNAADPWWNSTWSNRKSITVPSTKIDLDLYDFPLLVNLTDSDLVAKAQSDGDDIGFTDSSANKLSHEIEYWDSSTGHLLAWVKVPIVYSSTDTTIYMYYGNVNATSQEDPSAVWSSNFTMVHHLEEASGPHIDSTLRGNDGTVPGDVDQNVTGVIDGATELLGTWGYVGVNHSIDVTGFNVSFTASCWFRTDNDSKEQFIMNKYDPTNNSRAWYIEYRHWVPSFAFVASDDGVTPITWDTYFLPQIGTWYYVAVVWQSGAIPVLYINGTQASTSDTGIVNSIYNNNQTMLSLGRYYQFRNLDGALDEVRIAKAVRSSAWISAEYQNQFNASGFYTVGSEESGQLYYITALAGTGGVIYPDGIIPVQELTNKAFVIVSNDGFHVEDVTVDNVTVGAIIQYTFVSVDQNHTIEAQFTVTPPPIITLDKSPHNKGELVTITVSGGSPEKSIMLQINNPSGTPVWADQDDFATDGSYTHKLKIPTNWVYGTYIIRVRDVDAGTTRTANLVIKAPTPPPPAPPRPPPPRPPPPVNADPVSEAGVNQTILLGREVFFNSTGSYDPDGSISKYIWIFGDGLTSTVEHTSHIYEEEGVYIVELIVIDSLSATKSDTCSVTVIAVPLEPETGLDIGVSSDQTNYVVDATEEASTMLKMNTTGHVSVSVLKYPSNPYPEDALPEYGLPTIVDIFVSNPDSISWPIYVERHYTDSEVSDIDETRLALYYYTSGGWHICRETGVVLDSNIVWANMFEDEVEGSPTTIAERPQLAAFEVSELNVTPEIVEPGEVITVTVKISNIGGAAGEYNVTLLINGLFEDSESVSFIAGESKEVTFSVDKTIDGTYIVEIGQLSDNFTVYTTIPAEFQLSGFDLTDTVVEPGESIQGTVMVTNTGERTGDYILSVYQDGTVVHTESLELAGGESTLVTFVVSSNEEGNHVVQIDTEVLSFEVELSEEPPTPAEFIISDLTLSKTVAAPGEILEGSVKINNIGELMGNYIIEVKLDGDVLHIDTVEIAGEDEQTIAFVVSSIEPGSHSVESEDLQISFTIEEPPPEQKINWTLIDAGIIIVVITAAYIAWKKEWFSNLL